jgi:hypothetical protein
MKNVKKLALALLFLLGAFAALETAPAQAAPGGACAGVRCMACPEGYVLKPTGSDCCRCVPL